MSILHLCVIGFVMSSVDGKSKTTVTIHIGGIQVAAVGIQLVICVFLTPCGYKSIYLSIKRK